MPYESLHNEDFLERVKRSATYFEEQLFEILEKPIKLSANVDTGNKQAARRLGNALPDLKQAWLSRRYLLQKIAEKGFTVDNYLHEKQMSLFDAMDMDAVNRSKAKGQRTKAVKVPKPPKEVKPKTWEVSLQLYQKGVNPNLIAKMRNLTLGTVCGHLKRYVDTGQVSFDDLVLPEHRQAIEQVISKIGTTDGTTPIKNLCPPEVTYDEIRLVMERMKK